MKKSLLICLLLFSYSFIYSQTDTTTQQFLDLVEKVQNDKSLTGSFMYKGYKVNITENREFKTTIGKFIEIQWTALTTLPYRAVYHNTLGYMTRNYFNLYKKALKDYKVEKDKYCQGNMCTELREDKKMPYIFIHTVKDSELREIK